MLALEVGDVKKVTKAFAASGWFELATTPAANRL
jgi:hypothetical protein